MISPDRRISAVAFALAAIFLLTPAAIPLPAFAAGTPPFCLMRGGSNGPGGSPQDCAYYDYQACLQASVETHGNCVQNIDYHGEVSTAPAPARPGHGAARARARKATR
jgi:Protein of unknown function (DUF3551)